MTALEAMLAPPAKTWAQPIHANIIVDVEPASHLCPAAVVCCNPPTCRSGAGSPVSPRERAAGGSSTAGSAAAAAGDDGWSVWQRRRRHFFVLTAAGKPVFSRHGDEQALAGGRVLGLKGFEAYDIA